LTTEVEMFVVLRPDAETDLTACLASMFEIDP